MIFLILVIVVGLVFWALRLMDRAVENQEFSLMLAGFLVASSAAAMVGVYFLMSDYLIFMTQTNNAFDSYDTALVESELPVWLDQQTPYSPARLSALQDSSDLQTDVR
ncbi:MAG: hypothetical protein WBB01_15565 [Phormidesmis sp.]